MHHGMCASYYKHQTPWALAYLFTYSNIGTNAQWRCLLAFGALPAAIVVVCSMFEAKWYPAPDLAHDESARLTSANDTKNMLREMMYTRKTQMDMLVTGGGWFIYDVAYCKYI